jgi:hypothetical protein
MVVMSGVVKGVNFDARKNRSLLHMQSVPPSTTVRNRILIYVYNLFGEREIAGLPKKPESPLAGRKPEGIVLKPSAPSPGLAPQGPGR